MMTFYTNDKNIDVLFLNKQYMTLLLAKWCLLPRKSSKKLYVHDNGTFHFIETKIKFESIMAELFCRI